MGLVTNTWHLIPNVDGDFALCQHVHASCDAHPASCQVDTPGFIPGGKEVGVFS